MPLEARRKLFIQYMNESAEKKLISAEETFINQCINRLKKLYHGLAEMQECFFKGRGLHNKQIQVDAACLDEKNNTINLLISDFNIGAIKTLSHFDIEIMVHRMLHYFQNSLLGFFDNYEEESFVYSLAHDIKEESEYIKSIRLYIISTNNLGKFVSTKYSSCHFEGHPVQIEIFDMERILSYFDFFDDQNNNLQPDNEKNRWLYCPVCKSVFENKTACPNCEFDDLRPIFLNRDEAKLWEKTVVLPYFEHYCEKLNFKVRGRRLIEYFGQAKYIKIPQGVERIKRIVRSGFRQQLAVEIHLPPTVVEIEGHAFANCRKVERIYLPEGLKKIGRWAFYGCESLSYLGLPRSIEEIENGAFAGFDGSIFVLHNPNYRMLDFGDALVDKRTNKLIWLRQGKNIPEGIKIIGNTSLSDVELKDGEVVKFPDGVEIIEELPFGRQRRKKIKDSLNWKIEFPNTLKRIERLGLMHIEDAVLPLGLLEIGDYAFKITTLYEFCIPECVKHIGKGVLQHCRPELKVMVGKNNPYFYSLNDTCVIEKETGYIKVLGGNEVVIPNDEEVKGLCEEILVAPRNVKRIFIPKNIGYIHPKAFLGTEDLIVEVDSENSYYYSEQNCIIEKSSKRLIFCNDNSVIPSTVEIIAMGSLSSRNKNIVIPFGVKFIEEDCLSGSDCNVFCEVKNRPETWHPNWIDEDAFALVYWKDEWEYVDGVPTPKAKNGKPVDDLEDF